MHQRLITIPNDESLFVFGARGTGKSTLIKAHFPEAYVINLLLARDEERLSRQPDDLISEVLGLPAKVTHVFIDEIQKIPKLCDIVHHLIEDKKVPQKFILSGSSARKLKASGANLLAGRALYFSLYPFCYRELEDDFSMEKTLNYGLLPEVWNRKHNQSIVRFLRSYGQTYLKEEVWAEHLIRKLEPFRKFLEIAAQANSQIINYSNIARIVGVDSKTVQTYFQILEETYLAVLLEPFSRSIRHQVHAAPRFYFADIGVVRTLSRMVGQANMPGTSEYGRSFEQFIIMECIKLNAYLERDYRFSYITTKAGAEVDLVIERPGFAPILMEIKSTTQSLPEHGHHLKKFIPDFENPICMVVSQDPINKKDDCLRRLHWKTALDEIF